MKRKQPLQATVIYNPNSGGSGEVTPDELVEGLLGVGYYPVYQVTSSEEDLEQILPQAKDLVVVAGGDGSVRAVATRIIGKHIPIAVIPLGTANNIANTLGITGKPLEIVAGLKNPRRRDFDVGCVYAPWGEDYFLEACGYGLYADALAAYDPEKGKSVLRSFATAIETINNLHPYPSRITLDGEDLTGEYLLFEVLNTQAFGPKIRLAPQADSGDGLLDVVAIREDDRVGLLAYITGLIKEDLAELPNVAVKRGRKIEITWDGKFSIHVDAEVRPPVNPRPKDRNPAPGARPASRPRVRPIIQVEALPHALQFWLPEEAPKELTKENKSQS